jgi:hypothetical protein
VSSTRAPKVVHAARWCAGASVQASFDPELERARLGADPVPWGELEWARWFQEPPGPTVRPVHAWRSAVRVLLTDAGPVAATEVLLAHVRRHSDLRLTANQEAPAARDVRQALAVCAEPLYQRALAVAETHRARPEARRLAAYLFPDRGWWQAEVHGDDWLDLAPCPADLDELPTEPPRGLDRAYLSTLAALYGDAAVDRIARWAAHSAGLAEVLLDLGSDASAEAWLTLWSERASHDPGFREGIDVGWAHLPVRLLRAGVRLTLAQPTYFRHVRGWIADHPEAAAQLEPTLEGAEAEQFAQLRPDDRRLPEGWGERVLGSRRFRPPRRDVLGQQAAAHQAPKDLWAAGEPAGPPGTWTREEARERLLRLGLRHAADLVGWVLEDAAPALAVCMLLDTCRELGSGAFTRGAAAVRQALAWATAEAYAEARAAAAEVWTGAPDPQTAVLCAFLFPDEPWWTEVVASWTSEPKRSRQLSQLVPLPERVEDLPEFDAHQLGLEPLVPSWLWAYGAAIEPRLRSWLGTDSTSDHCLAEALLAIGTPSAIEAVVRFAYEPFEGYRNPEPARRLLETFGEGSPAALIRALAAVPGSDPALRRQVWRAPEAAETVESARVAELLAEVRPPHPPSPLDALPDCFHPAPAAPGVTVDLEPPVIPEVVRLSPVEQERLARLRQATGTGLEATLAQLVAAPATLTEFTLPGRTDAMSALLDDLALVVLDVHGPSAARWVLRALGPHQAPPAALCTRGVGEWMVENFDLTLIPVAREERVESLSEYLEHDSWRTRMLAREWIRRHPDAAADVVLWGALATATAEASDELYVAVHDLADLRSVLEAMNVGVSEGLRRGAQHAIPWMLRHLPGVLERAAERLGVSAALQPWRDHPGTTTSAPGGDLEWLELWRLPWVSLADGQVLGRPAVRALLELLAHTDPVEPHSIRDRALALLDPSSAQQLSAALRSQWSERYDASGLWVVDAPSLLGDPEAESWLDTLLTVGLETVQEAAMDTLLRRGNEQVLVAHRFAPHAMNGLLPWYIADTTSRGVALQVRIDELRALRGQPRLSAPRTAPPLAPPDVVRDARYAGLRVPLQRFQALVATGWTGNDSRLALGVGPGLEVVVTHTPGTDVRVLGAISIRDWLAPEAEYSLTLLDAADWGQVVADLDALVHALPAPDKSAVDRELGRALKGVALFAGMVADSAARGETPGVTGLDLALSRLADLAAPLGGFVQVRPHPVGMLELCWKDGRRVVVGTRPTVTTGVALVVTRARALLLPDAQASP